MYDPEEIGGDNLLCLGRCSIGTWNVEGLTDRRIFELQIMMEERDIGVLFMQGTYRFGVDYFLRMMGYLVILSGGLNDQREWAGVGFIISLVLRCAVLK